MACAVVGSPAVGAGPNKLILLAVREITDESFQDSPCESDVHQVSEQCSMLYAVECL